MTIALKPLFEVTLREEENKHFYTREGRDLWFVGATTILSAYPKQLYLTPWGAKTVAEYLWPYLRGTKTFEDLDTLMKDAKREHKRLKDEAGRTGTMFHECANQWIKGKITEVIPEEIDTQWKGFMAWLEEKKPKFLLPDTAVIDEDYEFGGSFDAVIEENDAPLLLDFKTSKSISQDYAFQLSAYSKAFEKTYGVPGVKGRVVRFNKTGKPGYEEKDVRDIDKSFEGFKACLDLYKNMALNHWEEN